MLMVTRLLDFITFVICIVKGEIDMVDMYVALVIAGRRTCNPENMEVKQVPAKYKEAVMEELTALGLDADGNPVG